MEIRPFKAVRFNPDVVGDVGNCVAPPYDVISPSQQQQLYEKSPYNIVRIIKGRVKASDNGEDNQYTRAADYFNRWMQEGALIQDPTDTIYGYVQDFDVAGTALQRLSFIASAKLEEFGEIVRPHEQIFPKPMADRLRLKRATAARLGLVFMLYDDQQRVAESVIEQAVTDEPLIDFVDEQAVRHRLFAITDKEAIKQITEMMSDKSCIIADGHHRYTTGLTYSKESADPAAKYQMLAFTNTSHEGLIVLATHRIVGNLQDCRFSDLVSGLGKNFEITKFAFASQEEKTQAKQRMLAQMKAGYDKHKNAFGIYGADSAFYTAVLKDERLMDTVVPEMSVAWRRLDVSVLHILILEELLGINEQVLAEGEILQFVKDTPRAIDDSISWVDSGEKQVAFFMNPLKMQQLKDVTSAGERMPQKSTYFYPKMYSGLTIHKL
ncbi:MAG: DUF1015 domain-containing protein [Phycisphaerales bacterium]|nr:MAG: DUF1015 domain-containing protein [Phycisphaerales bacterium]